MSKRSEGKEEPKIEKFELNKSYKGVKPRSNYGIGPKKTTQIIFASGSVVNFKGDAIVNAANEGCIGGGGVDGAINAAGGFPLKEARHKLPEVEPGVRCPTGEAVITISGRLKSKWVIHAVGPMFGYSKNNSDKEDLLTSAYQNSLLRGDENDCESVGFSLLSSSIFRGNKSLAEVLQLGIDAICEYFDKNPDSKVKEVFLVGYLPREVSTLVKLGRKKFDPSYVSEKESEDEDTSSEDETVSEDEKKKKVEDKPAKEESDKEKKVKKVEETEKKVEKVEETEKKVENVESEKKEVKAEEEKKPEVKPEEVKEKAITKDPQDPVKKEL